MNLCPVMFYALTTRGNLWVYFFTIREFGPSVLKHVEAWLPLACLRSSVAQGILGEQSNFMRVILRRLFLTDAVHQQGVLLPLSVAAGGYAAFISSLGTC